MCFDRDRFAEVYLHVIFDGGDVCMVCDPVHIVVDHVLNHVIVKLSVAHQLTGILSCLETNDNVEIPS